MKKAILRLLQNDDLCKEISLKGWEFVQKFNDENIANEFMEIYKSLEN